MGRGDAAHAVFLRIAEGGHRPRRPDRAGLVPEDSFDSCYDRAIASITGTKLSDPGMGLEWRLMPVEDRPAKTLADAERISDGDDTPILELEISVRAYKVLHRNGIEKIGQIRLAQLHKLPGAGGKTIQEIEAALDDYRARTRKEVA